MTTPLELRHLLIDNQTNINFIVVNCFCLQIFLKYSRWMYVAPMNAQRSRVALTANIGKLWAVGGYDGISNLVTVEVYDPKVDKWTYVAEMIAHEGGVGLGVMSIP